MSYGLLWNNHIIPNHGGSIPVQGPTPGPNWIGRIGYIIVLEKDDQGCGIKVAEILFPLKKIK